MQRWSEVPGWFKYNRRLNYKQASVCARAREMAVFLLNVCKFNECGIQFPNLPDLIHHIEATHIGEWTAPKAANRADIAIIITHAHTDRVHRPIPTHRWKRDSESSFYN